MSGRACYVDAFDNVFTIIDVGSGRDINVYPAQTGRYYGVNMTAGTQTSIPVSGTDTVIAITGDSNRNLYLSSQLTGRIVRVDFQTGVASVFAGTVPGDASGDDGPPLDAKFNALSGIKMDANDNLYVCDIIAYSIRKIICTKTAVPIDFKYIAV